MVGAVDEDQLRRIQIRETILSHLQRERQLFYKGIKVLSLFFIDEVANYREYDDAGQPTNGKYAVMFEEEYEDILNNMQLAIGEDDYIKYMLCGRFKTVDGRTVAFDSETRKAQGTLFGDSSFEIVTLDLTPAPIIKIKEKY